MKFRDKKIFQKIFLPHVVERKKMGVYENDSTGGSPTISKTLTNSEHIQKN